MTLHDETLSIRDRATLKVLHYNQLLIRGLLRRGWSLRQVVEAVGRKQRVHHHRALRAVLSEDVREDVRRQNDAAQHETTVLPTLPREAQA